MKYDVCIICAENDFYLGDLICQELEARGKTCRFNLRDAKSPTDLGMGWFSTEYPVYIAVVNREFIDTLKYNKLTEAKSAFGDNRVVLFINEDGVEIPSKWKHYVVVDANAGWEEELMDAIANGGPLDGLYVTYGATPQSAIRQKPVSAPASAVAMYDEDGYPTAANLWSQVTGQMPVAGQMPGTGMEEVRMDLSAASEGMDGPRMASYDCDRLGDMMLDEQPASISLRRAFKYLLGDGVVRDVKRAMSLAGKSLDEAPEDPEVLYYLGVFEECGVKGMQDADEAARLYGLSMERGFAPAAFRLGCIGLQAEDPDLQNRALEILAECRKAGDFRASYWIGRAAEADNDLENAYEYYSEAAEEGYAPAQNALGIMYFEGKGMDPDSGIAREWFSMAAQQGLPSAQANLADMMLASDGITEEALNLVNSALEGGELKAERLKAEIERIDREAQEAEHRRIMDKLRAEDEEIKARQREEAIGRIMNKAFSAFGRLMGD